MAGRDRVPTKCSQTLCRLLNTDMNSSSTTTNQIKDIKMKEAKNAVKSCKV